MRLFLDAHVSGRRVARALREPGHDVRIADAEAELEGLEDALLLALAASEGRIFVTFDKTSYLSSGSGPKEGSSMRAASSFRAPSVTSTSEP